jgi:menaquinone-dependent protoporphyrinogen oxidase
MEGTTMTVLVAYASKHGSTGEIAREIAERLHERGVNTELKEVGAVEAVDRYHAVVLGSAVYAGSWMKEAREFAHRFGAELGGRRVWLFSSGPTDGSEHAVSEKQLLELGVPIQPREHVVFGGRIDLEDLGFVEKRIVKMVKAPTGDFRDWNQVCGFADRIADALEPMTV